MLDPTWTTPAVIVAVVALVFIGVNRLRRNPPLRNVGGMSRGIFTPSPIREDVLAFLGRSSDPGVLLTHFEVDVIPRLGSMAERPEVQSSVEELQRALESRLSIDRPIAVTDWQLEDLARSIPFALAKKEAWFRWKL